MKSVFAISGLLDKAVNMKHVRTIATEFSVMGFALETDVSVTKIGKEISVSCRHVPPVMRSFVLVTENVTREPVNAMVNGQVHHANPEDVSMTAQETGHVLGKMAIFSVNVFQISLEQTVPITKTAVSVTTIPALSSVPIEVYAIMATVCVKRVFSPETFAIPQSVLAIAVEEGNASLESMGMNANV